MVRLEGNMSLKNPVAPQGIEPGTVRLVAQRLNYYATPDPIDNFVRFRFKLGSEPLDPDARRPYRQALCAPYHIKVALQLY
jgi:hypothetical protein